MDSRTLLVTLLGCCLAAGQSSPRQFEIASLPAHEEGYYLNRQFQNSPRSAEGTSEQENVRKVVDSQGRYWVVAEPATPEPGYYLNRHFQDKESKPKKNLNRVFLVKKNPETSDKTIFEVEPKTASVPDAMPSIHKVFPGLAAVRKVPVQAALTSEAKAPAVVSPAVARPESPSSTTGQRVTSAQDTVVSRVAKEKKPNPVAGISQPPQTSPSQRKTEQGGSFSCDGKEFGYYSDVESNCQQYHVCNPVDFGNGHVKYYKYSFSCSNAMRWDPIKRVCASPSTASPCQ